MVWRRSGRGETDFVLPIAQKQKELLPGTEKEKSFSQALQKLKAAPGLCSSSTCSQVRHLPVGIKMKQSSPSSAALMASSWFVRKQCKPNFLWNTVIISSEWENFVPLKRCSAGLFTSGSSSRRKGTCGE